MADWISGFLTWRARRRRFSEEWRFHREMAIRDLEELGLTRWEARRKSAARLGARTAYRRQALREIGGDWRALTGLLPIARAMRSPWLALWSFALAAIAALAWNPLQEGVLRGLCGLLPFSGAAPPARLIPLTPPGLAPTSIARLVLWTFLLAGLAKLANTTAARREWRAALYGAGILLNLGLVWSISWIAGCQILLRARWGQDLLQGLALIGFFFGQVYLAFYASCWWRHDLESRCPHCLRRLGLERTRGKAHDLLVDPAEVEAVCLYGHGQATKSRWRRNFECDTATLS